MSDDAAAKAYAAAEVAIARALEAGDVKLDFDHEEFRALESLPPAITTLTKLEVLDLDNTNLATLPDLSPLTSLRTLHLSSTKSRT